VTLDRWQEQLRRGGLDLAILLAVAKGPRYGLEIIRHLEQFTDLVVTEGTVYPILSRLSADGLLKAEWNASDAPHPRKYYRLTDRGRKRLDVMTAHWKDFIAKIARLMEAAQEKHQ
jgi:PadR family transcriptional regulator, regulatory protein PadR